MRYFLKLAYNGAPFHGWQSQPNAISVQEVVETAISKLTGVPTPVTGAGRTDTGVNARTMYAHFDTSTEIKDFNRFILSLDSMVGHEICIYQLFKVEDTHHARFDAVERTYKYFITFSRNPFLKNFCWFAHSSLDIEAMNKAAAILLETDDFTSFAKLHSDAKTNICEVSKAFFSPLREDKEAAPFIGTLNDGIVFTISADRFLRNMVRSIVGTLVEVGRKKISIQNFADIIYSKNRCAAGVSMPANALFLWNIKYPFITDSNKPITTSSC